MVNGFQFTMDKSESQGGDYVYFNHDPAYGAGETAPIREAYSLSKRKCWGKLNLGMTCFRDFHCDSKRCINFKCATTTVGAGSYCDVADRCDGGLACLGNTCTERLDEDQFCQVTDICKTNMVCDMSVGKCKKRFELADAANVYGGIKASSRYYDTSYVSGLASDDKDQLPKNIWAYERCANLYILVIETKGTTKLKNISGNDILGTEEKTYTAVCASPPALDGASETGTPLTTLPNAASITNELKAGLCSYTFNGETAMAYDTYQESIDCTDSCKKPTSTYVKLAKSLDTRFGGEKDWWYYGVFHHQTDTSKNWVNAETHLGYGFPPYPKAADFNTWFCKWGGGEAFFDSARAEVMERVLNY